MSGGNPSSVVAPCISGVQCAIHVSLVWPSSGKGFFLLIPVEARDTNNFSRHVFESYSCGLRPFFSPNSYVKLPKSLDETYDRTFNWDRGKREFTVPCLAIAARSLHVHEPVEVLVIRFDTSRSAQYHEGWPLKDTREVVLPVCSSLVAIVHVDRSPVFQFKFSHSSVQELLMSDRLADSTEDLSRFHGSSPQSMICSVRFSTLGGPWPIREYIIQDVMERLFNLDEPSFETWIWIYDVDYPILCDNACPRITHHDQRLTHKTMPHFMNSVPLSNTFLPIIRATSVRDAATTKVRLH